jgi:uncharacterized membrane-anchored protein
MKLSISKIAILCIGFLLISSPSFSEDTYESLNWQYGPKTQNILGISSIFLPSDYQALNIENTDKYLKISENIPNGVSNYFGPNPNWWDGYFSFDKVGFVKDDNDINADELLKIMQDGMEASNNFRKQKGWGTMTLLGWEYPPIYDSNSKRLEWAFLFLVDNTNTKLVNYETRILGRNGYMSVLLVAKPELLDKAINDLNSSLSTFKFNPGEKYSEYKEGDRVAEFGLAALIAGGAAALASKKGLWAMLMGLLLAAKKFAFVIIIGLFAGIASLFKRKK